MNTLTLESGWITPDGVWHPCAFAHHEQAFIEVYEQYYGIKFSERSSLIGHTAYDFVHVQYNGVFGAGLQYFSCWISEKQYITLKELRQLAVDMNNTEYVYHIESFWKNIENRKDYE